MLQSRLCRLLFFLVLTGPLCGQAKGSRFSNPVIPADSADPYVQYYGGKYYVVCTHGDIAPSTNGPGPSTKITIYASTTLGGLREAKPLPVREVGEFFESPELWHFKDRWYIYYTTPHSVVGQPDRNFVRYLESVANDPLGPYARSGVLQAGAWDATILQMRENRYLLSSSGGSLLIQKMNGPRQMSGPAATLSSLSESWEKAGNVRHLMEAPEVLEHGGQYFILYTAGDYRTNDYRLGALKYLGGDPLLAASWQKIPGPLFQGNGGSSRGAGDCTPFRAADGSTWFAYSGWENSGSRPVRSVRVQKLLGFDAAGNPLFPPADKPGDLMTEPEPAS